MSKGVKHNTLNVKEVVQLTKLIEGREGKPFEDWDKALQYFSTAMARTVTRANLNHAAKACDAEIDGIVKRKKKSAGGLSLLWREIEAMRERIEQLEEQNAELSRRIETVGSEANAW